MFLIILIKFIKRSCVLVWEILQTGPVVVVYQRKLVTQLLRYVFTK